LTRSRVAAEGEGGRESHTGRISHVSRMQKNRVQVQVQVRLYAMCLGTLLCVALCCSARVCCSVLQCVAVCRVLQCIAVCCSALQCIAVHCSVRGQHTWCANLQKQRKGISLGHGNTLQNTATHCNTMQHTATLCNTMQRTTPHTEKAFYESWPHSRFVRWRPQHTATHYNILAHVATHCNILQHTATRCTTHRKARSCEGEALMNCQGLFVEKTRRLRYSSTAIFVRFSCKRALFPWGSFALETRRSCDRRPRSIIMLSFWKNLLFLWAFVKVSSFVGNERYFRTRLSFCDHASLFLESCFLDKGPIFV